MLRTAQSLLAFARTHVRTARSTQPHDPQSSSVGILPVELLLKVFEQLDRKALSTCMRVCWRWYDIASPSFFAVVPIRYFHRQPLVKHFCAHPELAAYVQELHFFDMSYGDWGHGPLWGINPRPFDVQLLASTLPLFTNLTRLSITGCDNKTDLPQLLRRMTRRPHTPVPLQRLTLMSCGSDALMLHGLFSLFSVDTLVMAAGLLHTPHEKSAMRIEALFSPPAPVTIQNLVIRKVSRDLYEFLEGVLAPGGLQGLATSPTWQDDISHLHQFLRSPAAQNLVSINISPRKEFLYDAPPDVLGAPLVHKTFGAAIAQCTRVQYLRLGLVYCSATDREYQYLFTPYNASCSLLATLPASLRAFSLHIWIKIPPRMPRSWAYMVRRWNTAARSLAAIDRSLDPAEAESRGRFRHLRRVELDVHFWNIIDLERILYGCAAEKRAREPEDIRVERVVMPLPRLKAAGLLREFRVDDELHDDPAHPEFTTDLYWPEM